MITIAVKTLREVMGALMPVVEARNTIPILSTVLLSSGPSTVTFTVSDMDIIMQRQADLAEPGKGRAMALCVDARALNDIARKLPADAIATLEPKDGKLLLKAGRSRFNLPTLAADDFPIMATDDWDAQFEIPSTDLVALIDIDWRRQHLEVGCSLVREHKELIAPVHGHEDLAQPHVSAGLHRHHDGATSAGHVHQLAVLQAVGLDLLDDQMLARDRQLLAVAVLRHRYCASTFFSSAHDGKPSATIPFASWNERIAARVAGDPASAASSPLSAWETTSSSGTGPCSASSASRSRWRSPTRG